MRKHYPVAIREGSITSLDTMKVLRLNENTKKEKFIDIIYEVYLYSFFIEQIVSTISGGCRIAGQKVFPLVLSKSGPFQKLNHTDLTELKLKLQINSKIASQCRL